MNIGEWLIRTMIQLKEAGVDSPRRDALVLLEDVLERDRAWVTAHPEYILGKADVETVDKLVQKRLERVPLAYIRGKAWFYGRFFAVNQNTLIPRPESENFIELLKVLKPKKVIDIGTGSGALAITAKLEMPKCTLIATDVSSEALTMAQKNAQLHDVDVQFLSGSLVQPFVSEDLSDTVLIANLPYVPEHMISSPEITQEPPEALFSGNDGLDHYREFWAQITTLPIKPCFVLIESLESQHRELAGLAHAAGYMLEKTDILIQQFKLTSL